MELIKYVAFIFVHNFPDIYCFFSVAVRFMNSKLKSVYFCEDWKKGEETKTLFKMVQAAKNKIQLFQMIQRNLAKLGISSNCFNQFDRNLSLASLSYGLNVISNGIFLLHETNNFREFTNSFNATYSVVSVVACFVIVIYKVIKLFEFIENCEKIIDKREKDFQTNLNWLEQFKK